MRRRRFHARQRRRWPVRQALLWLDRLQVALTFLLLLALAITAAGYCSAQHLRREEAAMQRLQQRVHVEQGHEEI